MKKQLVLRAREKTFLLPVFLSAVLPAATCSANPQGMTVVSGSAHPSQQGSTLEVTTSQSAFLNWNSFNIAAGETTVFNQPSSSSIVVNNIKGASPSAIYGSLHANGIVILQNSAGFYFGPNAFVSASGLVVTTMALNPWSLAGGAAWTFDGPPVATPIVNYGHLQTVGGGSLFLLAKQIDNYGTISTPGGTAGLVAGQEVLLSQRANGLSLSAPVKLPVGSVDNHGQITADAGQILLQAENVNNSGEIAANSVRENNGVVELYASQNIQLSASSVIQANGDASGNSRGGNITINSGGKFSDNSGSQIAATGGANGGNGGNISLCAPDVLSLDSTLSASAQPDFTAGTFFFDPTTITISATGTGTLTSGTLLDNSTTTPLSLSPATLNGESFSSLDLQASQGITFTTPWTVPANSPLTSITLQAGTGGITFDAGDSLTVLKNNASVTLVAGANFSAINATGGSPTAVTKTTSSGVSSIIFDGNASVSTTTGSLDLVAGGGITIGTGTVETTGGNITLQAEDQSIALGGATTGSTATPWTLPNSATPATVNLEAANNITMASGGGISAGNNWTVNLGAGVNSFTGSTTIPDPGNANSINTVPFGVVKDASTSADSITLAGSASVSTTTGLLNLIAGGSITFGSGIVESSGGNMLLEAQGDNIALGSTATPPNVWKLPDSTAPASLILEAANNITMATGGGISAGNDWTLTFGAGVNNFNPASVSQDTIATVPFSVIQGASGTSDSITLTGSAKVQSASGNITAVAANALTVGTGGIVTGIDGGNVISGGGGNVSVQALSGNINCGTTTGTGTSSGTGGYTFGTTGAVVSATLDGISTGAGGNVYIQAGGNITAASPSGTSGGTDAGSGAFGPDPGNVTLIAVGNVTGHYVLADGAGSITAVNAGTSSSANLALSLITGGWTVNALDNIFLSEVRNPNGMLNQNDQHLFNYSPLASVDLNAGNGVTITGSGLLRAGSLSSELVLPPSLTIDAGAGGIGLPISPITVVLYPSPEGTLNLTTAGGGNLGPKADSVVGATVNMTISDSTYQNAVGSENFTQSAPGNDPLLHLNDPNPVNINISGSISGFSLFSPKPVQMYAAGNIINSTATAINLSQSDTTAITAGGEIFNQPGDIILTLPPGEQPDFAALAQYEDQYLNPLTGQPNATPLSPAFSVGNPNYNPSFNIPTLGAIGSYFKYFPATGQIVYTGNTPLSQANEAALLAMPTPFLDPATIEAFYAQSQAELGHTLGYYQVVGPGTFKVSASSIELGNSDGLLSAGIGQPGADNGYALLVPYTLRGADLDISTSGDLSMLSSAIESEYGGAVNITAGGSIDVGSALLPSSSNSRAFGIISLWQGDISVVADGDINVDGSRIAAYDGGNIFVESLQGNIDAGSGGSGNAEVNKPYVNKQGVIENEQDVIPGSGILASSFPQLVYGDPESIGNITIETPEGNIVAGKGGVQQLALGPGLANDASVTLDAGSKNSDGSIAYVGNIDASGSGIVGGKVTLSATGNVNGLVIASVSANVSAIQNVSATVLSSGSATVSAGGTVSGSVVGLGVVSVSGASDVAAAFSATGVSASGAVSGAAVAAVPTGSSSASSSATSQQVAASTQANSDLASNSDEDDLKKKKSKSQLMEYVGRVRVLLPE